MDANGQLQSELKGQLAVNVSMGGYTSWRAGGRAKRLYIPNSVEDLSLFLKQLPQSEKVIWFGLGSNTLVRDGGIPDTIVVTQGSLNQLEMIKKDTVFAQAGVSCGKLARFASRNGISGLEFLAGVPGTIGGSLAMNAGCWGSETWDHVVSVETMNRQGKLRRRSTNDFNIGYRQVLGIDNECFISGIFKGIPGDPKRSLAKIKSLLDKRNAAQPTNLPSGGSVFRNPKGDYAARLIEACGLKGHRIGGACISTKHANFIVNDNKATAADIIKLIEVMREAVLERFGISLFAEVKILGEETKMGESC